MFTLFKRRAMRDPRKISLFPGMISDALSRRGASGLPSHPAGPLWFFAVRLCIVFCHILFFYTASSAAAPVQVEVVQSQDKYPAGGSYPILFKIRIAEKWYLHGPGKTDKSPVYTALAFQKNPVVRITDIAFPPPDKKKFSYSDEAVDVYSGHIQVRALLEVSEKAPPGPLVIEGQLSYQSCTSACCMPPARISFPVNLSIAPPGAQVTFLNREEFKAENNSPVSRKKSYGNGLNATILLNLLGIFLGGMALNLTPCIYPLIPITVSYFGGKSGRIRGRTILHGLLYISGLAITNSLLGLTASLTGSMLGCFLQHPIVLIIVSGILFFMALSFFDFWQIQLPAGLTRFASKNFGGYFGTFFMGLTLGIVAAPCLGPFMLGLLTYVAQLGKPLLGFLYFLVLSLGMGIPLAVLAVFSGTLKKLPLSGEWLLWIRKGLGWVLVGMSAYIIQPLVPAPTVRLKGAAIILGLAGLHLGWLDRTRGTLPLFKYFKKGVGVVLIALSAIFFLVLSPTPKSGIMWVPYDQSLLAEAVQERKPVILDFYAQWCAPCRALEENVFSDPEIVALSQHFVTIRVDLTKSHPGQDEIRKRYQIKGVPSIVFINRDGVVEKNMMIGSYVNRQMILDRMKRLIDES